MSDSKKIAHSPQHEIRIKTEKCKIGSFHLRGKIKEELQGKGKKTRKKKCKEHAKLMQNNKKTNFIPFIYNMNEQNVK